MAKATGPNYKVPFKRRRENKTNYYKRFTMLKSGKPRLVIRASNKNVYLQLIEFDKKGDKVIGSVCSKELKKFGWLPKANTPTAYLSGLLITKKIPKNIEAILDIGMATPTKGRILFAAAIGAKDGGLKIKIDSEMVPWDRIVGKHIATYAQILQQQNPEKFNKLFSDYIKNNIDIINLDKKFEEIKNKILNG